MTFSKSAGNRRRLLQPFPRKQQPESLDSVLKPGFNAAPKRGGSRPGLYLAGGLRRGQSCTPGANCKPLHWERYSPLHAGRRASQVLFLLLILLLPVLNILRLDTATHELIIFGRVWTLGLGEGFYLDGSVGGSAHVAMQFLLRAVLPWIIVLSIFPVMGTLFGRLFCGWLCPEGSLFELADFLNERILGRREPFNAVSANGGGERSARISWPYAWFAIGIYIALPPVLALCFAGYFIAPATIYDRVISLQFGTGLMAAVVGAYVYVLTTSVFLRHGFCKYICAPGLMQMMFGWISPVSLRIRFYRARISECTECRRCEEVCFMDVKPRAPRRNINCVNCGECVTACRRELGENGLFSYRFGVNGSATAPRAGIRNMAQE